MARKQANGETQTDRMWVGGGKRGQTDIDRQTLKQKEMKRQGGADRLRQTHREADRRGDA